MCRGRGEPGGYCPCIDTITKTMLLNDPLTGGSSSHVEREPQCFPAKTSGMASSAAMGKLIHTCQTVKTLWCRGNDTGLERKQSEKFSELNFFIWFFSK